MTDVPLSEKCKTTPIGCCVLGTVILLLLLVILVLLPSTCVLLLLNIVFIFLPGTGILLPGIGVLPGIGIILPMVHVSVLPLVYASSAVYTYDWFSTCVDQRNSKPSPCTINLRTNKNYVAFVPNPT